MNVNESCAACMMAKQRKRSSDPEFLAEVRRLLENRRETDCSPYMGYLFNEAYARRFGRSEDYRPIKRRYNDLVLGMEDRLRVRINAAPDPLAAALVLARIGNYVDFGALENVDEDTLLSLFDDLSLSARDADAYASLLRACAAGRRFLLICDNCGEIALDRLFLEQLRLRFPHLELTAMVRGGEVSNDATAEDAEYVGIHRLARIVSNGMPIGGTIYETLPPEAREALDEADVILAKGQGNYESLAGQGRHAFYAFLCKCDLFVNRFQVPRLTGMLVEEG